MGAYLADLEKAGVLRADKEPATLERLRRELAAAEDDLVTGNAEVASVRLFRLVESPRYAAFDFAPDFANAELTLARALVKAGGFKSAERYLLRVLGRGPKTQFFAVDIDPAFVRQIQKRWPAVRCVCASAERLQSLVDAQGMGPIDHIVSGLPFVSLPPQMTRQILDNVTRVLRPGGTFTTFQYLHGYGLPPAISFRRSMSAGMGGPPSVRLVLRNVPPAIVLTWRKGGDTLLPGRG